MTFLINEIGLFFSNQIVQGILAMCAFTAFYAIIVDAYTKYDMKKDRKAREKRKLENV